MLWQPVIRLVVGVSPLFFELRQKVSHRNSGERISEAGCDLATCQKTVASESGPANVAFNMHKRPGTVCLLNRSLTNELKDGSNDRDGRHHQADSVATIIDRDCGMLSAAVPDHRSLNTAVESDALPTAAWIRHEEVSRDRIAECHTDLPEISRSMNPVNNSGD